MKRANRVLEKGHRLGLDLVTSVNQIDHIMTCHERSLRLEPRLQSLSNPLIYISHSTD